MAFGFQRGLFGRKPMTGMPGPISGFGGGTFNMDGTQATPVDRFPAEQSPMGQPQDAMQAKPSGGMFGKIGGAMGDIGSILDDDDNGRSMQFRQQQEQQQRQAVAQRQQERDDWLWKQEYEAAHPKPANNDTIADFNWYKSLSEADRETYHRMKPQYMTVDNGDGTKSIIPIGANGPIMGGQAQPRTVAPSEWDSAKPLGGGAPSGTGNFPAGY